MALWRTFNIHETFQMQFKMIFKMVLLFTESFFGGTKKCDPGPQNQS